MDLTFDFIREGGTWMYGILALGFLCLPLSLLAGVLHGMGKRLPSLLWVGPLAAIACMGAVGTLQGAAMTRDAIAHAAPDMKQQMFAQGLSISMYTTAFAALATTVLGLLFAGAVSLGHLLSLRGERGRWTVGSGLAAVGLGGAGVLTAAVMTVMRMSEGMSSALVIWAPAFGLVSLLALALVGLRADADPERLAGSAGARFTVWACVCLSVWGAMLLPEVTGEVITFKAVATIQPSEKGALLQHGLEIAQGDGRVGLAALVGLLLAGLPLLLPLASAARRSTVWLVLNTLMVAATLALLFGARGTTGAALSGLSETIEVETPEDGSLKIPESQ